MKIPAIFDVSDAASIVTGGASGLGLAFAEALADNGAKVTVADINGPGVAAAVDTLKKRNPSGQIHGVTLDVTDREAVNRAFDDVVSRHGRLDVVFANAGIHGDDGFLRCDGTRDPGCAIENITPGWLKVIDVNLNSILTTIQAAARIMKTQRDGGRIVATASVAALGPSAMVGASYIVAKSGVVALVRQAALELAKYRIRVNALAPGAFQTGIMMPDFAKVIEFACPMHRVASTEEIQGAALFLASAASSYMTGSLLVIDGGLTLGQAD